MTQAVEVFEAHGLIKDGIPMVSRQAILMLEDEMVKVFGAGEHQETFPVTHRFANDVYAREILLPAETLIIGKIHRHGHLNVITKGRCAVLTEFGVEDYVAPCTFISLAGTKRAVYAYEDTVWTTFHGTSKTNVDEIEADIICKTFEEFDALQQLENKQ